MSCADVVFPIHVYGYVPFYVTFSHKSPKVFTEQAQKY